MLSDRTADRLRDIIEDAGRNDTFVQDMTVGDFMASEKTVFAIERLRQRITEAAVQIDPADAERIGPDFPVARMRGLGDRLRHEYRDLDRAITFRIATIEVPALSVAAQVALDLRSNR